jgi:hypothetical protein
MIPHPLVPPPTHRRLFPILLPPPRPLVLVSPPLVRLQTLVRARLFQHPVDVYTPRSSLERGSVPHQPLESSTAIRQQRRRFFEFRMRRCSYSCVSINRVRASRAAAASSRLIEWTTKCICMCLNVDRDVALHALHESCVRTTGWMRSYAHPLPASSALTSPQPVPPSVLSWPFPPSGR